MKTRKRGREAEFDEVVNVTRRGDTDEVVIGEISGGGDEITRKTRA